MGDPFTAACREIVQHECNMLGLHEALMLPFDRFRKSYLETPDSSRSCGPVPPSPPHDGCFTIECYPARMRPIDQSKQTPFPIVQFSPSIPGVSHVTRVWKKALSGMAILWAIW